MNLDMLFAFLLISAVIAFSAYFVGKKKTAAEEKKLFHKIRLLESQKSGLNREISDLNQKLSRYVYFLMKIPEAVMQINSNLNFDSLVPSIIRMVKELIDTNEIEIYMFEKETQSLKLVAAFGTNRKKSIVVKFKEGVVGCAAEIGMIFTKDQLRMSKQSVYGEKLEKAIPMRFANRLIGVIGIGKIKMHTLNEERFLAMIADIAAIAFHNCEHMDVAKEEAIKDALTGLYNRRHFFEKAHEAIQKSKSYGFPLSVFIFDIDNFKHYNDTNGHPQGDALLKEMSSLLKKNIRSTNIIARYGGEEFIVLLQNTNKENAMRYAENIRRLVESHPFPHKEKQPFGYISLSGGVAEFPPDGKSIHEVIKHADEALYQSKKAGKNRNTQYETPSLSSSKE
jgi:diguanylate cyclase (GGDEF)-like protein